MIRQFTGWSLNVFLAVLGVVAGFGSSVLAQDGTDKRVLRIVADVSGSEARSIAVGISSLANQKVEDFDIDITWTGFRDDSLRLVRDSDQEFGLIDLSEIDLAAFEANEELRAVMIYWPQRKSGDQAAAGVEPGYLMVAKPSVEPGFIQAFVEAVQADAIILKATNVNVEKLAPDIAMAGLPLPLHQGVLDYLNDTGSDLAAGGASPKASSPNTDSVAAPKAEAEEVEVATPALAPVSRRSPTNEVAASAIPIATQPAHTPLPENQGNVRSYILYFDSSQAELDGGDFQSIARACGYASRFPNSKIVISGHADSVGSEDFNIELAGRRAENVAKAIRNDPRFRDALDVVEFGEDEPAFETGDDVSEALNRRVMITILPGE